MAGETGITRVLEVVDRAYNDGELRICEDLPPGERGDTLADFISIEVREVCEDSLEEDMARDALNAIERARDEITAVCEPLYAMDAVQGLRAEGGRS